MMSQIVNRWYGATVVNPWTVGRLPEEDVEEILYELDLRAKLRDFEEEAEKRKTGRKAD